jgi:hypothetical protein
MKEIVARADTALYFAKSHGRNQTCQYESLQASPDAVAEVLKFSATKKRE